MKVLSVTGQKVSLSMKDVNQDTGEDLNPKRSREFGGESDDKEARNPDRPSTMPLVSMPDIDETRERTKNSSESHPQRNGK